MAMATREEVKIRYFGAISKLYSTLRAVPSTRQLVDTAGGSNSTAENYIDKWCQENNVERPAKSKKPADQGLEEAFDAAVDRRTLEACKTYNEDVERLETDNFELKEKSDYLGRQLIDLQEKLGNLEIQNQQLIGEIRQLEKETATARQDAQKVREISQQSIEEFRQKVQDADEARRKAEFNLASLPENSKRVELDQLIVQVSELMTRSLDREERWAALLAEKGRPAGAGKSPQTKASPANPAAP